LRPSRTFIIASIPSPTPHLGNPTQIFSRSIAPMAMPDWKGRPVAAAAVSNNRSCVQRVRPR